MSMPELRSAGTLRGPGRRKATRRPARRSRARSPWRLAYARLRRDRAAKIALASIIVIVLLAIFAPVFAEHHRSRAQPAVHRHRGERRTAARWRRAARSGSAPTTTAATCSSGSLYGARISLLVGVVATAISVVARRGVRPGRGLLRRVGRHRHRPDHRRDAVDPVPAVRHLARSPLLGPSLSAGHLPIDRRAQFFGWASSARIVRGQVISIKEKEYVEAARALGAGPWRIMFIDILPNVMAQVIVYATLLIPLTIVGEASLSFLGVGVQPPTADWGADDQRRRPATTSTGPGGSWSSPAWRC